MLERGQEGFDGGDRLVDQSPERNGAAVGCPALGGGEQNGDERGRGELDLIVVGGSPGAAGQQAGDQADGSALLPGVAGIEGGAVAIRVSRARLVA